MAAESNSCHLFADPNCLSLTFPVVRSGQTLSFGATLRSCPPLTPGSRARRSVAPTGGAFRPPPTSAPVPGGGRVGRGASRAPLAAPPCSRPERQARPGRVSQSAGPTRPPGSQSPGNRLAGRRPRAPSGAGPTRSPPGPRGHPIARGPATGGGKSVRSARTDPAARSGQVWTGLGQVRTGPPCYGPAAYGGPLVRLGAISRSGPRDQSLHCGRLPAPPVRTNQVKKGDDDQILW